MTHRIEALEKQVVHLNATYKLLTKMAQEMFRIAGSMYEVTLGNLLTHE